MAEQMGYSQQRPVYIFNIGKKGYTLRAVHGNYGLLLPAGPLCDKADDGTPFTFVCIAKTQGIRMDMGSNTTGRAGGNIISIPEDLKAIANDLISKHDKKNCLEQWGVFVGENARPTPAELERVKKVMHEHHLYWYRVGNEEWARRRRYEDIDTNSLEAAEALGENPPWLTRVTEKNVCPGCGTSVKAAIAKCGECGAILDAEKAFNLGMIDQATYDRLTAKPTAKPSPPRTQSKAKQGTQSKAAP